MRARICAGLLHLGVRLDEARNARGGESQGEISALGSPCTVRVVRTSEETIVARETSRLVAHATTTAEGTRR